MIMVIKMEIKNKKNILKNSSGQSLFEFIIFLPLFVILFGVFYSFGNSINMSINQQKAVRGYFYHLLKGNSYGISYNDLKSLSDAGIKKVGFSSIGWRVKSKNGDKESFGNCYKVPNFLGGSDDEECDSPDRPKEGSSKFIRAFTVYGICTNNYVEAGGVFYTSEDPGGSARSNQIGMENCSLQK